MNGDQQIAKIATRFGIDVFEIQEQINFLQSKSVVRVSEIDGFNHTLRRCNLEPLPTRDHLGRPPHHLTVDEIRTLASAFGRVVPKLDQIKNVLFRLLDELPEPIPADESFVSQCVDYVMEVWTLTGEENSTLEAEFIDDAERQWVSEADIEEELLSSTERRDVLKEAFRRAKYWRLRERIDDLQSLLDRAHEISVVAKSSDPNSTMGPYRQGFIAMMAAFDAAIFDLVRLALNNSFFKLAGVFGSDQLTIQRIADLGSFEAVREEIIETQLKKRYVKDLLRMLKADWRVEWFERNRDAFPHLMEIVLRRNLHLHNRGVVDQRYLDSKKNVYALQLGEVAVIDKAYWQRSQELCQECVSQVTSWADSH